MITSVCLFSKWLQDNQWDYRFPIIPVILYIVQSTNHVDYMGGCGLPRGSHGWFTDPEYIIVLAVRVYKAHKCVAYSTWVVYSSWKQCGCKSIQSSLVYTACGCTDLSTGVLELEPRRCPSDFILGLSNFIYLCTQWCHLNLIGGKGESSPYNYNSPWLELRS